MRICHVTPHLPPDQAANALLPYHLGCWARDAGDEVSFIAHPPRAATDLALAASRLPGPVAWIAPQSSGRISKILRSGSLLTAARIFRAGQRFIEDADRIQACALMHDA